MPNLQTAKVAIEAEIAHLKQGLAFYHSQIESLEKTLLQLASIGAGSAGTTSATTPAAAKRGPKPASKKATKPAKADKSAAVVEPTTTEKPVKPAKLPKKSKAGKGATGGSGLPFTGGDFWPNLVTAQPQSASEILNAAIASLGFTPTKAQLQKLAGRQTFAVNALVKSKAIQDSGKGRERRFFKA